MRPRRIAGGRSGGCEVLAQALRPGRTDQLDEFLVGGVADACDGAEMPEQRLDGAGLHHLHYEIHNVVPFQDV